MRVLPGSHGHGVLEPAQIAAFARSMPPLTCAVPAGGALVMRPLLLHASPRAHEPLHRRVVHLEFAAHVLPGGPTWRCARGRAANAR